MHLIDQITPEQEALAIQMRENWFARTNSTAPIDTDAAVRAINRFYSACGEQQPEIVWCESPFQLIMLPFVLQHLSANSQQDLIAYQEHFSHRLARGFTVDDWQQIEHSFWRLIDQAIKAGVPAHLAADKPPSSSKDSILGAQNLNLKLTIQIKGLTNKIHKSLTERLNLSAIQQVLRAARPTRFFEFENDVKMSQTNTALTRQCASLTYHPPQLIEVLDDIWWGLWQWHTLLIYEIAHCIDSEFLVDALKEQFDCWLNLQRSALGYRFFKGLCFVCGPPCAMHLDERYSLHNDTGYALRFPDGYTVHALHGVVVPPQLIEHPELITVSDIINEPNVEMRRIMIERTGIDPEHLLDCRVIDQSQFGTLLRREIWDEVEPLVMVIVENSTAEPDGSRKTYFLRVPPDMMTARAAVAWTFGMAEYEYNPVQET
jgi:hypothetical protein